MAEPRGAAVRRLLRRRRRSTPARLWFGLPGSALIGGADGAARPRRRDGERLHLPRAVAAGLEHAVHAAAVHLHGRRPRAALRRGGRRRRSRGGWRSAAAAMAGAQLRAAGAALLRAASPPTASSCAARRGCCRRCSPAHFVARGVLLGARRRSSLPLLVGRPDAGVLRGCVARAARSRSAARSSAAICSSSASCRSTWPRRISRLRSEAA